MKTKELFILNLKTFIIDLIIFVIGIFLLFGFLITWRSLLGQSCLQPPIIYLGLILIIISIIHFIINLIIFIYKKLKKRKK